MVFYASAFKLSVCVSDNELYRNLVLRTCSPPAWGLFKEVEHWRCLSGDYVYRKLERKLCWPLTKKFSGTCNTVLLDGPEVESRWEARCSALVQSGPGAHPPAYKVGSGSLSRG
jgi:hypothetical protein